MGKFISTTYSREVEGVTSFNKAVLNNDLYLWNSQGRGTKVTYYHINKDKSTLDEGSKLSYTDIGDNSPIRFDVIYDLYIYQFNRNEVNFNNDEFGLESSEISGESYIIPEYHLEPYDGDFFTVDHADEKFLYKVRDADRDTLANRSNVWKINWVLDRTSDRDILKNIVGKYKAVETVNGSGIKPIIELTKYDEALNIEKYAKVLVDYFKDLFYSEYIQTFTYKWYTEYNMYDPYAIEFMIRNQLLSSSGMDYMYIEHKTKVPTTFSIDYDRSIFRVFETCDRSKLFSCMHEAQADLIEDPTSIFNTRYEQYFKLTYRVVKEPNGPFNPRGIIPTLDEDIINRITDHKLYDPSLESETKFVYRNIFIKFFYHEDINSDDIDTVMNMDFCNDNTTFYELLLIIYILYNYEKTLLS